MVSMKHWERKEKKTVKMWDKSESISNNKIPCKVQKYFQEYTKVHNISWYYLVFESCDGLVSGTVLLIFNHYHHHHYPTPFHSTILEEKWKGITIKIKTKTTPPVSLTFGGHYISKNSKLENLKKKKKKPLLLKKK